jgi:hypothetical protein
MNAAQKALIGACVIGAALVLWFSWMFRYAPMSPLSPGDNMHWVWDRWANTPCWTVMGRGARTPLPEGAKVIVCSPQEFRGNQPPQQLN